MLSVKRTILLKRRCRNSDDKASLVSRYVLLLLLKDKILDAEEFIKNYDDSIEAKWLESSNKKNCNLTWSCELYLMGEKLRNESIFSRVACNSVNLSFGTQRGRARSKKFEQRRPCTNLCFLRMRIRLVQGQDRSSRRCARGFKDR